MGKNNYKKIMLGVISVYFSAEVIAASPADKYPESLLYSKPVKVAEDVWSSIGATQYYSYENAGHNNNLSFVIGNESILVVNGGASYLLAKALHDEIKKISNLPVKYVVDENGQSHAVLGNGYWKEQGATIIAHEGAIEEIEEKGLNGLDTLKGIIKERAEGTKLVDIDKTFEESMELELGGLKVELLYLGPAHSPGDITVHIPDRQVIIAGDMAFHQRMLPIFPETDTASWLETWHESFTPLSKGKTIIPGHGEATDFATVDKWTRGYLEYLRSKVAALLEDGGALEDAYEIDQSPYAHLETYDLLAGKNAGRVFEAMEFE